MTKTMPKKTTKPSRNVQSSRVTAPKSRKPLPEAELDPIPIEDGPEERFRLYRRCVCFDCQGKGYVGVKGKLPKPRRCEECRGEGRVLQRMATCPTPQDVGCTLVTLAQEGEFDDCPFGLLDTQGEKGKKWLILPFEPSPRNVTDAARVLARSKKGT